MPGGGPFSFLNGCPAEPVEQPAAGTGSRFFCLCRSIGIRLTETYSP